MSSRFAYPAAPGPRASRECDGCGATPMRAKAAGRDLRRAMRDGARKLVPGNLKLRAVPGGVVGRLCGRCRKEVRRATDQT